MISFCFFSLVSKEQCVNLSLLYSNRAACELKIGDVVMAIKDTTRALELVPHSVKPLLRRGAAYEAQERYGFSLKIVRTRL